MYGRLATISENGRVRGQRRAEIAFEERHRQAEPLGVAARHLQRAGRNVDREDGRRRKQLGQRQRDGARAGADVGHAGRRDNRRSLDDRVPVPSRERLRGVHAAGQPLARHLDQRLGVGARDQHARVDGELQPPELFLADQVGDRLAGLAPLDERADGGELVGQKRPIELHVELQARQTERVRHQQLGVEARRRQVPLGEPGDRPADDLEDGPARRRRRRFGRHGQAGHFIRRRSTGTPPRR